MPKSSTTYTWMQMDASHSPPSDIDSSTLVNTPNDDDDLSLDNPPQQSQKKPRHRHSPAAIAALNELYDRDEHPALELRTSLAKRLGMEVKTVNAWFQNKRASSKKQRSRARPASQRPSLLSTRHPLSQDSPRHNSYDDYIEDDDYPPSDSQYSHNNISSLSIPQQPQPPPLDSQSLSAFYAGNPDHTHFLVGPDMPRKMRNRPSTEQTEELRKLYSQNQHPSTEQRQLLAQRIGMRYQSITNWFQNQRSLAKKRKEEDGDVSTDSPSNNRQQRGESTRTFSAFPPPPGHPSLHLPPPSSHPSLGLPPASVPHRSRRSPSVTPSVDEPSPPKRSKRSSTPYGSNGPPLSRPRRTRPEPYQLHALKELSLKTINPSIEARTALAAEIGMDLGKVTNWFRNLRQTARKRATKKAGSGDEYDDNDAESYIALSLPSASVSRSGSPFIASSSSSSHDDSMDLGPMPPRSSRSSRLRTRREPSDFDDMSMIDHTESQQASDDGVSDDDYQEEAVTPSPDPSPSPPSPTDIPMPISMPIQMQIPTQQKHARLDVRMVIDRPFANELDSKAAHTPDVTIEDALLLLTFHRHAVH